MFDWLKRLFGGSGKASQADALALQREAQSLRLELEQRDKTIASLTEQLERQRAGEQARVGESVGAHVERLLSSAAAAVSQLNTQAHLIEAEHKPVKAADVLAVARQLVHVLEDAGLMLTGDPGQTVAYDPDRHEPLAAAGMARGEEVVVRFVGVTYRGKVLHRAGVEKVRL